MADRVKNKDLLERYLPLKRYSNDLPFDLAYIIENRFSRFKEYLDDIPFEQMRTAIKDFNFMASQVDSQSEKVRIYIFTGVNMALFVNLDFIESEAKHITKKLETVMENCPKKLRTKPAYVSTIYIFQGEKITYFRDLYPSMTAEIISRYHSSDLLIHKMFLPDVPDNPSYRYL